MEQAYIEATSGEDRYLTIGQIRDMIYPVGSIYMSTSDKNPGEIMGGAWEAWGPGRVPVGVDANQTEFNTVEKADGQKTVALTTSQMPKHTHSFSATTSRASLTGSFMAIAYKDHKANGIVKQNLANSNVCFNAASGWR